MCGRKRAGTVVTKAMGREREFMAWDLGEDTFVFERGISKRLNERPSVLIVEKKELSRSVNGRVMTLTSGNHSVAAFPLLDGRFWNLSRLPSRKRGEVLMHRIICANVVAGALEISQRDVAFKILCESDAWLLDKLDIRLDGVVFSDRNEQILERYRSRGQEWRVKPLAWTETEMRTALSAAHKKISSSLSYYHSMRGVHFMSFAEFRKFTELSRIDGEAFVKALRELVSIYEGNKVSFTRMPKFRGHHEIEFFGIRRGIAIEKLVPELEKLMEAIVLGKIGQLGIIQKADELLQLYESLLSSPAMKDETSREFIEQLYMHITGEVYSIAGEGMVPAFDDRKTALPGATFVNGRPIFHPGADERTEVLLSNLRSLMSKDEIVEYANVYELRSDADSEDTPIGKGKTREIVYKTNRSPVEHGKIEKRFSFAKKGYSSYMLSRIEAFKALGMSLSEYRVLRRRAGKAARPMDYFIRNRLEGEPIDSIPANYFCSSEDSTVEEKEFVLSLASLMGDAAAQNMAMKKFDPATNSPIFGVGKEIYEFEYDISQARVIPKSVSTCSVRGSFGWPNLEYTDENLGNIANFYLSHYVEALKDYQSKHAAGLDELAERFMSGFEFRTRAMVWKISVLRENFEAFKPNLPRSYNFDKKWKFILWSLERQERRLGIIRKMFFKKAEILSNENIRNNS
jgi:hypothetical protein